jgi:hypothetical protein
MQATTRHPRQAWYVQIDAAPAPARCLPVGLICAEYALILAVDLHLVIYRVDYEAHCVY